MLCEFADGVEVLKRRPQRGFIARLLRTYFAVGIGFSISDRFRFCSQVIEQPNVVRSTDEVEIEVDISANFVSGPDFWTENISYFAMSGIASSVSWKSG